MKLERLKILLFFSCTLTLITFCKDKQAIKCPIKQNNHNLDIDISLKDGQVLSCLKHCLRKGWNQCIYKMIQLGEKDQKQQLIRILTEQRKRLEILQQQIVLGESQTQPVLKWGQNMTHIFITFKLSHRWDSPPCLNTKYQQSDLDSRIMYYENVCLVSHQKVTFILNLDFYKDVVAQSSLEQDKVVENSKNQQKQVLQNSLNETQSIENQQIISSQQKKQQKIIELQSKFQIKKDGVGTYSTILEKAKPQIWIFLDKKLTNYALWNEIGARYSNDLRTQQSLLEEYRAYLKKSKKQSDIPKSQQ